MWEGVARDSQLPQKDTPLILYNGWSIHMLVHPPFFDFAELATRHILNHRVVEFRPPNISRPTCLSLAGITNVELLEAVDQVIDLAHAGLVIFFEDRLRRPGFTTSVG